MRAAGVENSGTVIDAAAFWIGCAKVEARDPSKPDSGSAHRAWLKCHPQGTPDQPLGADGYAGAADREDLSVRRGVIERTGFVAGACKDFTLGRDDDGTDGHFSARRRGLGLAQGVAHEGCEACHSSP